MSFVQSDLSVHYHLSAEASTLFDHKKATARLGEVLQDADRLDSLGAIGIMRNIACAQAMRTRGNQGCFYDPEDPFGKDANDLPTDDLCKKIRENVHEILN